MQVEMQIQVKGKTTAWSLMAITSCQRFVSQPERMTAGQKRKKGKIPKGEIQKMMEVLPSALGLFGSLLQLNLLAP